MRTRLLSGLEFLRAGKSKLLWGLVLGLVMALPAPSGAQMTVGVDFVFLNENGLTRVGTNYISQFSDTQIMGLKQDQYVNSVLGYGGPTQIGMEFQTNENSEIVSTGLTILKEKLRSGDTGTMLRAEEKIGTSYDSLKESFVAAAGSRITVTETMHATEATTLGGGVAYVVQSSGVGSMEAGVAGQFKKPCLECQDTSKKGGTIEDLRLQTAAQVQQMRENLTSGTQFMEMHIDLKGPYSGVFQAVIQPPK